MNKKIYVLFFIFSFLSCKSDLESILGYNPKLDKLWIHSSMANYEFKSGELNSEQYLILNSIINSISPNNIKNIEGKTYKELISLKSRYINQNGFDKSNYLTKTELISSAKLNEINNDSLFINIDIINKSLEAKITDELVLIVNDIIGNQIKVFTYKANCKSETNDTIKFGAIILANDILEEYQESVYKPVIDKNEILKNLRFKTYSKEIDYSTSMTYSKPQFYQMPNCTFKRIKQRNPNNESEQSDMLLINKTFQIEDYICE